MKVGEIKNHNNFVPACFEFNTNKKFLCLKLNSAIGLLQQTITWYKIELSGRQIDIKSQKKVM